MARRTRRTRRTTRTQTKVLFVIGGVLSGVGKGTAVSAIGRILLSKGFRVTAMKIDPYLNVDAGTMNPTEHGEVFVTTDGLETDQDLGNYERFLGIATTRDNYMTLGQVYRTVIERERNLGYGGKCVEPFYHIPLEIISRIERLKRVSRADIILVEVGGTVGEYQNLVFLEAARILHRKEPTNVQFLLVSYLPIPSKVGEMKTKPTQHAVQMLHSAGIQPDFVLGRSAHPLDQRRKEKISLLCDIDVENVVSAPDVESIYDIPLNLDRERVGQRILERFGLTPRQRDLVEWRGLVRRIRTAQTEVRIGIVGKYFATGSFTLTDSYISVIEAIKHAAWSKRLRPVITWLDAESFESPKELERLKAFDGIIVPGGFGSRGVEGKIAAIQYVRTHGIPYFGLCYGMQLAVIEFTRHVLKRTRAHTTEVDATTPDPVIDVMASQKEKLAKRLYGGTMRLGGYRCRLARGSIAAVAYGATSVVERHRHRYEVNGKYRDALERKGMRISGINPDTGLAEIAELSSHPFFLGTQFHPEFQSRPLAPHPLFVAFVQAAAKRRQKP
ncbi:MAG: CTP synthase [Candidatus Kerfeldbacteria bacterium]|nr:CTP synthase [Candidatus Kerfeldbacteria bacterium]